MPPNLGGQAMTFPKTSASQGFSSAFEALGFCAIGCFPKYRSDLSACLYSTSFNISILGGGARAGVGGFVGGSGGSSSCGAGGGGGAGSGADHPSSRSSSSLNFQLKSSSKLSSYCLVKPAIVMETIGLCSGSSTVRVIRRNSSSFQIVPSIESNAYQKDSVAFASAGG